MRFIGNKTRLLQEIKNFLEENNISGNVFCDIFAGTSSVGDYLKSKYKIISNDFLKFSADFAKAKLQNSEIPNFKKFRNKHQICPFVYLNKKIYKSNKNSYITNNYSPKANRKYFSIENAVKIDGIRIEIEEIYKSKIFSEKEYNFLLASLLESAMHFSNTSGTYEAFLKKWDRRALKPFLLSPIKLFKNKLKTNNEIYNEDSNSLIRKIKGDILYIDPPYTTTEYSSAYHVLETLSRYDFPNISGITGRRIHNDRKSFYTRKKEAILVFEDLIRQANFSHIVISYSNESIIPINDLEKMLKKYAIDKKIVTKKISYRTYKNIRKNNKSNELFENLIYFRKDNAIKKSPLNYSGSKDRLMLQITKYLPGHIDSFIDVMGGAFNVGVNVVASEVVYNENNRYVYEITNMLLNTSPKKILIHIKNQIKKFNLIRNNTETYNKFRAIYNNQQNAMDLFVLSMFSFQNQLRFNSSFKFNVPVGNCAFNKTLNKRIRDFKPKIKNISLLNSDFQNLDYKKFSKSSLFYFDPPYFITNGSYNDGKRGFDDWNANWETKLLKYITSIHDDGYKFMLSNVINHKNKTNHILMEWIKTHEFNIFELKSGARKEILITNYNVAKGKRK